MYHCDLSCLAVLSYDDEKRQTSSGSGGLRRNKDLSDGTKRCCFYCCFCGEVRSLDDLQDARCPPFDSKGLLDANLSRAQPELEAVPV